MTKCTKSSSVYVVLLLFVCFSNGVPVTDDEDPGDEPGDDHPILLRSIDVRLPPDMMKNEYSKDFWINNGKNVLENKLKRKVNTGVAKNVILFLGDGMSVPTLAAARILKGQREGKPGEEAKLGFEDFPFVGLSKTYCVNSQVADSACSATAYLNGVKGNIGTIGVTAAVEKGDCKSMNNASHHTSSFADWAQKEKKATGIVTTTRVTHASPAGAYAHTAKRRWEYDAKIIKDKQDPKKCMDIAKQLVLTSPGKHMKVVLGGGRAAFWPRHTPDPEYTDKTGWRKDNRNLVHEWLEEKKNLGASAKYVWNKKDMYEAMKTQPDYIMGLFEPSHMQYHMRANPISEPTLEEMVEVAITTLQKEPNGFFLFVEGGKIDLAHHGNLAQIALDETIEFDKAIQKARSLTNEEDTLIVVTADHAHTMAFSGYPERGSDILTKLQKSNIDSLPYSTISYANGPGYKQSVNTPSTRYNLSNDDMGDAKYRFPGGVPLGQETHGGDDVAVFASGPWAHLLTGNYEQNVIPLVMGYASRIGPTGHIPMSSTSSSSASPRSPTSSNSPISCISFSLLLPTLLLIYFVNTRHLNR